TAVPWFQDRVQAHFDGAFPETAGKVRSPEEGARQFGWQVLIQPGLFKFPRSEMSALMAQDEDFTDYLLQVPNNGTREELSANDVRITAAQDNQLIEQ